MTTLSGGTLRSITMAAAAIAAAVTQIVIVGQLWRMTSLAAMQSPFCFCVRVFHSKSWPQPSRIMKVATPREAGTNQHEGYDVRSVNRSRILPEIGDEHTSATADVCGSPRGGSKPLPRPRSTMAVNAGAVINQA